MSENDEFKRFLPNEELENERIVYELPSEVEPPYQEKIPSGYDPMSEIYLRGRAFRGLAGGRIPWWVLIAGWILFGGLALSMLISMISSAAFELLPALLIVFIPVIILWRGTAAKLSLKKHQRRRRM